MTKTILPDNLFGLMKQDGQQRVQLEHSIPQRGWQVPAYVKADKVTASGYADVVGLPTAGYSNDRLGFVHMKGFLRHLPGADPFGTAYSWTYGPFFYLPDGYCIEGEGVFVAASDIGPVQVSFVTSTSLSGVDSCAVAFHAVTAPPSAWLALDGIHFLTKQKELVA